MDLPKGPFFYGLIPQKIGSICKKVSAAHLNNRVGGFLRQQKD
jgi:hypothetical protein